MRILFILSSIFLLFENGSTSSLEESWHWSWICNDRLGRCERLPRPAINMVSHPDMRQVTYGTLQACKLTCGKYGSLWPRPTIKTVLAHDLVTFHPSGLIFDMVGASGEKLRYLSNIRDIFQSSLVMECGGNCTVFSDTTVYIKMTVAYEETAILATTDESYSLNIKKSDSTVDVSIQSLTVFGARHALETLSQLVAMYRVPNLFFNSDYGLLLVANATIKDKPIYAHRGLMLDTGRNFLDLEAIERQMDAMGASKLNVLHWHMTDSPSFPVEVPGVPYLAKYGAYSPKSTYTMDDIRHLKEYANLRGIRIMMEIDAPAHAGNGWQWGEIASLGKLAVCVNQNPWRQYCIQPPCGQLNPANENVYSVLGELYKDLQKVMIDGEYFHMGGDEVFGPCWNSTDEIVQYMEKQGLGRKQEDFLILWAEFQKKALAIFDNKKESLTTPIVLWSSDLTQPSIIESFLPRNRYIIQTWVPANDELPTELLKKGYRLIISTKDAWYLDHGFWGSTKYHNWRVVYKNKLPKHENVLGGEVCMWGELVDSGSIDSKIWPRAAAAAERLWTDPTDDTSVVEGRFYRHRERLMSKGIHAEALAPRWCYQNEGECL